MKSKHGISAGGVILIIFILLLIGAGIFIFSNSEARKEICGTHQETYTSTASGCDGMSNCQCLHKSWAGLGACDSCSCYKEVSNC